MNLSRVGQYMDAIENTFIQAHLPPTPARVLDIGGGTGRWSRRLTEAGHQTLLIEPQTYNLHTLQREAGHLAAVQGLGEALPVPDAYFDAALLVQVIDFIPDRPAFFREVWRVLKPNGIFLLTWTNKHSLKGAIYSTYSALKGQPPAERYAIYGSTHAQNMTLIQDCGFRMVAAQGYSWVVLPRSHNTPLVDLFATIERGLGLRRWLGASPNIILAAQKV